MEPLATREGDDMNEATTATRTQVRDPICGTDVDPATYPKSSMALELAVPTYTARQVHYTCPIHPRDRAGGASNQIGRNVVASQTEITFTSLAAFARSEEHTSELQSLMRISYAVFCLKKKNKQRHHTNTN